MTTRLGNVAYWIGLVIGGMLCLSAVGIAGKVGLDALGMVIPAAIAVGVGWAIRYVLSGRSDWRLDAE